MLSPKLARLQLFAHGERQSTTRMRMSMRLCALYDTAVELFAFNIRVPKLQRRKLRRQPLKCRAEPSACALQPELRSPGAIEVRDGPQQ